MFVAVKVRRLAAPGVVAAVLGAFVAGCSNLEVKKVPVADREAHVDHQEGFRYYLNRPYLVVKKPILISEAYSLVKVDPVLAAPPAAELAPPPMPGAAPSNGAAPGAAKPGRNAQPRVTFLDGARRGQTVNLADLQVESPGSGELRRVSPAELQKLKAALAAAPAPSGDGSAARRDDQVVQAQSQVTLNEGSGASMSVTTAAGAESNNGAGGDGGAALATNTASSADLTLTQVGAVTESPALSGDMQIVYLPDLDEQYAIKSCNIVAKSSIGLAFKNGSELVEVDGDHDSTTIAVSLLQQIQSAIGVAQSVEQARIQRNSKALGAGQTGAKAAKEDLATSLKNKDQPVWQLVERSYIRPGVYRLNKPWENGGGPEVQPAGCGLLAKLGLPTVVSVDFKPVATIGAAKAGG